MRVVWTILAQQRMREIRSFVAADVLAAARTLGDQPHLGRPGRLHGTRELGVAGTPYLLIYRARYGTVELLTVIDGRHQASAHSATAS